MKTKNYKMHFGFHYWWSDWALPVRINVESLNKDYAEIELQILCLTFSFTRITHKYIKELNKIDREL